MKREMGKKIRYFKTAFRAAVRAFIAFIVFSSSTVFAEEATQKVFSNPSEAMNDLLKAVQGGDKAVLSQIFGPNSSDLINSGDDIADKNAIQRFARRMEESTKTGMPDSSHVILYIGKEAWPFPIPLKKQKGKWLFDTAVGREEILNRRIGKNELEAISVCRDYVESQQNYARQRKGREYSLKLITTPGKKDGLYEEAVGDGALGTRIEKAKGEGYGPTAFKKGGIVGPYHGYFYKILTEQGPEAPGGKRDYRVDGKLSQGFGLVSFPAVWKNSGVMTFIVNQDGQIFQKNLGEKTAEIAQGMTEYNPDKTWTPLNAITSETRSASSLEPEKNTKE